MNDAFKPEHPRQAIPTALYWAMTMQFAVGGATIPFVSVILRDRGLSFSQISHIILAASATSLIFPFLWGMLADRFIPMNRLFTLLNFVAAISLGAFAIQREFAGLLIAFTAFVACFNPTLTLINALSFHHLDNPQAQFGRLRAWGSLGWILPSLPIYLWLTREPTGDLGSVVWLAVGTAVLMVGVTLFLPHTRPGGHATASASPLGYWPAMRQLLRNPSYITIVISFFLIAGSSSILMYYSPPFLEQIGIQRKWLGPIQCIGVVFEIILFPCLPAFIRRWNYTAPILIGCFALCLRHLLFSFSSNPWVLSASYLLAGTTIVFYHTGISILVNSIATREVRASAQTILVFFGSGMGPMFANWMAGRITGAAGNELRPVFLFAAVLAGLAGILVALRTRLSHS